MRSSLHRRRSRLARPLSWLVVAGLAGAALIGPGAGGVAAANEPGSPDFVPNSGHTSSSGLTLAMGTATINCDGSSVNSLAGSFTFSGNSAGDHVVIYLVANNGSDATPAGNVQNNELTIDLDGKTSPVHFSLPITSPFTTTSGGVLIVFASDVAGINTYNSKSNSLNCTDTTTTSTSSTSTSTSTSDTSSTSTSTSSTSTSTSDTSSTSSSSSSTSTSTSVTTSQSSSESSTSTSTSDTTTTESGGVSSTTTSSSSSGDVLGIQGTPGVTPPSTDTFEAPAAAAGLDGFRMVLLGLAVLLAMALLVRPRESTSRK